MSFELVVQKKVEVALGVEMRAGGGQEDGVGEVLEIQEALVCFESEFEIMTVVYFEEGKEGGVNRGGKERGTCVVHEGKVVVWFFFRCRCLGRGIFPMR